MAKEIDVDNWEDFENELRRVRQRGELEDSLAPLLFRGHADASWPLSTTLDRSKKQAALYRDYYRLISLVRAEVETFTGNQWEIPSYTEIEELVAEYDSFSLVLGGIRPRPAYNYMVYLRHHGFPSPLLDWSRSPYVAAYFAFSRAVDARRVSIYVLSEANFKRGGNGLPGIVRMGPYVKTHRRRYLQHSDYTMCLVFGADNEWRFAQHDGVLASDEVQDGTSWNFSVVKYNIPISERNKVLKLLDEYNLNAFSLFGSDESLMETMALRKLDLI